MSIIKYINEDNHVSYDTVESVQNLINYIMNPSKILDDQVRVGYCFGDYVGCIPFFGTEVQQKDSECVCLYMAVNNQVYNKSKGNLMKHRVISFHKSDCVLPEEANELAQYIANAYGYGEKYITAYGVHLDTENIHIHLAIDAISWADGRRFDVSFEGKWLRAIVTGWENTRNQRLSNNPQEWERRLNYYEGTKII